MKEHGSGPDESTSRRKWKTYIPLQDQIYQQRVRDRWHLLERGRGVRGPGSDISWQRSQLTEDWQPSFDRVPACPFGFGGAVLECDLPLEHQAIPSWLARDVQVQFLLQLSIKELDQYCLSNAQLSL